MKRSYTDVMRDIASIAELNDGYAGISKENMADLIRELAELPARRYRRALSTIRTLARIENVGKQLLERR